VATRRLALIGATEGPWVATARLPRPTLRVRRLSAEHVISVEIRHADDSRTALSFNSDGDFPLEKGDFMKVSCSSTERHSAICEIYSERVA
jgi:hypothetical protein